MLAAVLRLRTIVFLCIVAVVTPCLAQSTRGGGFLDPPRPAEHRHFTALVVGINYAATDPKEEAIRPTHLDNAEADATAFHKMLTECYDYNKNLPPIDGVKTTGLLIGEKATKAAIESQIQQLLCTNPNIKSDDYVLFYFAGHGRLRRQKESKRTDGYILPNNVEGFGKSATESDAIWSSAVEMDWIVKQIINHCPARHKLLILDCCHSGAIAGDASTKVAVYEHGKIMTDFDTRHDSFGVSNEPVIQAITATRLSEEAADGNVNSPFTEALLKSMKSIPRRQGKHPISVTQIFQTMQFFLSKNSLPPSQTPTCIWLGPDRGDFQFFPSPAHVFEEVATKEDNEREQKMLLAMVPGNFGNWWFDETPWFIPSLRLKIVKEVDERRGTNLELITKESLRAAANEALKSLTREVHDNPASLARIKHLRMLLEPAATKSFQDVLVEIERELKRVLQNENPAPHEIGPLATDLHLLAVLRHKLNSSGKNPEKTGETDDAGAGMEMNAADVYEKALERYEEIGKTNWEYRPLEAMCHADYALLLKQSRKFEKADQQYRLAHAMYYAQSPEPFRIFVLCQQAEALRALGLWTASSDLLRQAEDITKRITPEEGRPKPAIIGQFHRARAWAYMEQWEIKKAMADFQAASDVFETLKEDATAKAAYFHAQHGLAMAERFQGRTEQALVRYRRLTRDIAQELRGLGDSAALSASFGEVRVLLAERLVNSLERQGDCNLFSAPPDFAEAADDYRRAIRYCAQLSADRMYTQKMRMLCKRALALAMPSPSQDVELAGQVLEDANTLESVFAKDMGKDPVLDFHKSVAATLVEFSSSSQEDKRGGDVNSEMADAAMAGSLHSLREAIDKRISSTTLINRDELESLMFATSVLIDLSTKKTGSRTRAEMLSDIELLTDFCRTASREAKQDADLLGYLRPTYDVAIGALIASNPKQAKELIELVWESQHGEPYDKPEKSSPVLMLYATDDKCYFMLDVPHGASKMFPMDDINLNTMVSACNPNEGKLRLPNDLRKELVVLNERIAIHWYDPVHIKPGQQRNEHSVGKPLTFGEKVDNGLAVTTFRFPFDVGGLLVLDENLTASIKTPTAALGPVAAPGVLPVTPETESRAESTGP